MMGLKLNAHLVTVFGLSGGQKCREPSSLLGSCLSPDVKIGWGSTRLEQ